MSFVEERLLTISGRYERRFHAPPAAKGLEGSVNGYQSFSEVARDLNGVIDNIWVSGTRSL